MWPLPCLQPLCPSETHLRPCRAEPQRVWPSALATAAPVPRVAPASRKALKSCDHPPASRRAVCLGPGPAVLWGPWEEPHPTPQPGSGQRDRLLARLDIVRLTVCSQQHRERKPALHVRRGAALTHCSERRSAAPPTTHSPGIRGPCGGRWTGVHGVFPAPGLPPPRMVDSPGPTFSSGGVR